MKMRDVVAVTSAVLVSFGAIAGGQQQSSGAAADPATVRQAQEKLTSEGFDPGPVDGKLGQQTRQGLMEFQQSKGLEPSGQLDAQTIAALGLDSSAAAGASSPGTASPGAAPSSSERAAEPASGG